MRLITIVSLLAVLAFHTLPLQAAGFVVSHPVPLENKMALSLLGINPLHLLFGLLIVIGVVGYLQKKNPR